MARISQTNKSSNKNNETQVDTKFTWCRLIQLALPIWTSHDRPRWMRAIIVGRIALIVIRAYLAVYISYPFRDMATYLNKNDEAQFWNACFRMMYVVAIYCPVQALDKYCYWFVKIKWRKWMTMQFMSRYYQNDNFYHLLDRPELDNPGMRICDDVAKFVEAVLWITETQLGQLFRVIGYVYVLLGDASAVLPFLSVYTICGSLVVICIFGPPLALYNMHVLVDTANFRGGLIRTRENAESIAFYKAAQHEEHWAISRLRVLIGHSLGLAKWEAWLRCCNNLFTWVAEGAPYIILAPAFFSKQIEYGIITQAAQAFNSILRGTTVIIRDLSYCTELKATATRLIDMMDAFDEKDGSKKVKRKRFGSKKYEAVGRNSLEMIAEMESGTDQSDVENQDSPKIEECKMTNNDEGKLVINSLSLRTPGEFGHKLVQNLSLTVEKGSSLLIVGPSGVGKSSLLRAICGLWEASTGKISMPEQKEVMFLPQNPYIPEVPLEVNTLKTQLLFPRVFANNTDEEIIDALKIVNLAHLMGAEGVYSADDWRKRLSGGEKQRLAMARLLLAAPKMAFLDESTSALDDDNEMLLYKTLQGNKSSYASVGHRKELLNYHSHILELAPGGGWTIKESEHFKPI